MNMKTEYLAFKNDNRLKTNRFPDRVLLQEFLRDRLERIWDENPHFVNGGLLSNHMTGYGLGFAYYDCRPSRFCREHCYGLRLSGLHDYFMLRLGVLTSESLKTGDPRFLVPLRQKVSGLPVLKIGHWGDATTEQIPVLADWVASHPQTTFWWYTRKLEIALQANQQGLVNLKAYLSLDPSTVYPSFSEYPYGITYVFGNGWFHGQHNGILQDERVVAIFPLKKGPRIEEPDFSHPQLCPEKELTSSKNAKTPECCLSCYGRCFHSPRRETQDGSR